MREPRLFRCIHRPVSRGSQRRPLDSASMAFLQLGTLFTAVITRSFAFGFLFALTGAKRGEREVHRFPAPGVARNRRFDLYPTVFGRADFLIFGRKTNP